MRILKKVNTQFTLLFVCSLLFATNVSFAEEQAPPELKAPIMEIDLDNGTMVVAEQDVHLLSQVVDGKKVWKTAFVDDNGNAISVGNFKKRDRVLVRGEKNSDGAIEAREIIKLSGQPAAKEKSQNQGSGDSNFNKPLPPEIRLEGGVWKN